MKKYDKGYTMTDIPENTEIELLHLLEDVLDKDTQPDWMDLHDLAVR